MKRILIRLTIVTLCLGFLSVLKAAPAAQDRFGTLESLSAYFPKDTMLYAAMRTDAELVGTLDRLMQTVETQLPAGIIPSDFPVSLTAALDILTGSRTGGTFNATVRPWLGDTLAVGIYPAIRSAGGRMVVKITDAKAAAEAAAKALPDWTRAEQDGYTLLTDPHDVSHIAIYSDVLVVYSWSDDVGPEASPVLAANVTANPYYTTALARLPDSTYDMVAFVDTPLLLAYNERETYQQNGDWLIAAAVYRMLGSTGIGVHVGADQTLTLDVAQTLGNTTGLDALGVRFTGQGASLNPAILERVPRDAVVVAQAADVGAMAEFLGNGAQSAAKKFQVMLTSIITGVAYNMGASTAGLVSGGFASLINSEWANVFFSNLSGYDYNSEIRPLLGGSTALFLTLNPNFKPNDSVFVNREPFDGALLLEAADAAAAQHFVAKIERELAIAIYTSGDHNTVRIQEVALAGGAQGVSLSIYGETGQPFDEFIVTNVDNLLVIGTGRAVNRVMGGDGLGFTSPEKAILPGTGAAMYVNLPAAQSPEWTNFTESDPGNTLLQLFPYLAQSIMISAAGSAQNDLLLRVTLTLPCGDNCG